MISTYFVRIIETLGAFMGILVILVVAMMGRTANSLTVTGGTAMHKIVVSLVSLLGILVIVIVILFYAVRERSLKMPPTEPLTMSE